jgi:uncharacterized membrane protein YukC
MIEIIIEKPKKVRSFVQEDEISVGKSYNIGEILLLVFLLGYFIFVYFYEK